MPNLLNEQCGINTSSGPSTTTTYSLPKLGEHVYKLYNQTSKSKGKHCICVQLTKYAPLVAISTDYKAPQVVIAFFKETFRLHGLPKNIISD